MNQKRYQQLLNILNISNPNDLLTGQFLELKIKKVAQIWEFYLQFPSPLSLNSFQFFIKRINEVYNENHDHKIKVLINYENVMLNDDHLEEYYRFILEQCIDEKPRFATLKVLNTHFSQNTIKIYVGSEDEIEMVKSLIPRIQEGFGEFYLNKIAFSVSVSNFETPIAKTIADNLSKATKEAIQSQEMYDRFASHLPEKENNKIYKKPKMKAEINGPVTALKDIPASEVQLVEYNQKNGTANFVILGDVISASIQDKKGVFKIYEATIFDGTDSIIVKIFLNDKDPKLEEFYREHAFPGNKVRMYGLAEYDRFSNDIVIKVRETLGLGPSDVQKRVDQAKIKRVELHAHTKMSTQDGVMDINDYVNTALDFGHTALAVTDHFNIQALPDLYNLTKGKNIKPIYGVEGALIDEDKFKIAFSDEDINLKEATFVVYDLETTGLSSNYNEIIEIAAVKIKNEQIIDEFATFVKPEAAIPNYITEITNISNDDVRNAPSISAVIGDFYNFLKGSILVAQNASFDNSHLYKNLKDAKLFEKELPTIDTMQLARIRYGNKLKTFNLKSLSKFFDVDLKQHHRAINDAKATAEIFVKMLKGLFSEKIYNYQDINSSIIDERAFQNAMAMHINILSKNKKGTKNLNLIISDSHTTHFYKEPRILKKYLQAHREGLLLGSSCCNGEIFDLAWRESYDQLLEGIRFYDYIEIQPVGHYLHLFEDENLEFNQELIKKILIKIINASKECNKPVVATGDAHILNMDDYKLREIFINAPQVGGGIHKLFNKKHIASQHFMTTDEMLQEFSFLGNDLAFEIVVTNTNYIADQIEYHPLFTDRLYAPSDDFMKDLGVPSFKQAAIDLTYKRAHLRYGENLPLYILERIKKELNSIINNNYASIYYISHLLVKKSQDDGYVVGSRGSVGSSLVAFFMGITEVNSLPPHYYCPHCHFVALKLNSEEKKKYPQPHVTDLIESVLQSAGTGYDLPDYKCPVCGNNLSKDGCDIPFETFLGFKGDKIPDIDLNFSGDYQNKAHEFCRDLFGVDNAFRAGTITTIADKTAYGYVKGYLERKGVQARNCEIDRLGAKITGVKRSTGQHPGGIVVIPKEIEYSDIIPVQFPADDITSTWRTTHYDYHKFESNLLKLDILGHDDPTMIRHLMDFVEKDPQNFPFSTVDEIPFADNRVIALFSGVSSMEVDATQVHEVVGTTGIPEFGTTLAKDMLREIRPKTVNELIKISGLSHGTDVWNGNARDYMLGMKKDVGPIDFKDLIGCRDDIMNYLLSKGLPAISAFKIMESVRKGNGVSSEFEEEMLNHQVPKWYIDSCKSIKYMFPKAHASAYVIMALRIGWFKVYRPLQYYAAYFSRRANAYDIIAMAGGYSSINLRVKELEDLIKIKKATNKEIDIYNCLILALEMTARGFTFQQIDIEKSDWRDFLIEGNSLIIPFKAMDNLGEATAKSITDARNETMFSSTKDIMRRTKINATVFEKLSEIGAFKDLPNEDQIGLF
ncbi:MAG: PolC-type DNA polymerase III [Bacilli bacterium]